MFSVVAYSAKKYKLAIFRQKPTHCWIFGLVPKSPTLTGLICVKTLEPNISSKLGPLFLIQNITICVKL
jgi:hypothetical protein